MTERCVCCWWGAEDYSMERCMTDATYTAVTLAVQEMLNKRQILIYQSMCDLHSDRVISFFLIARWESFSCNASFNFPTKGSTISKWFTRFFGNIQQGEKNTICCPKSDIALWYLKAKIIKKVQKQLRVSDLHYEHHQPNNTCVLVEFNLVVSWERSTKKAKKKKKNNNQKIKMDAGGSRHDLTWQRSSRSVGRPNCFPKLAPFSRPCEEKPHVGGGD